MIGWGTRAWYCIVQKFSKIRSGKDQSSMWGIFFCYAAGEPITKLLGTRVVWIPLFVSWHKFFSTDSTLSFWTTGGILENGTWRSGAVFSYECTQLLYFLDVRTKSCLLNLHWTFISSTAKTKSKIRQSGALCAETIYMQCKTVDVRNFQINTSTISYISSTLTQWPIAMTKMISMVWKLYPYCIFLF